MADEDILEELVRDCTVVSLFPAGSTEVLAHFSKSLLVLFDLETPPEQEFDVAFIGQAKKYALLMRLFEQINANFFIVSFSYDPDVSKAIDHSYLKLVQRLNIDNGLNLYKKGKR